MPGIPALREHTGAPHVPQTIDREIDGLLAARAKINAMLEKDGVKVSVNDLVIKAVAVALKRVPEANSSYTPEGIALHHHADIAMAVAIDGGLITPIIRAAETKGLAQIAVEAKDLAARARDKKLKPEEFQGGTFSISNMGMMGIKSFASIINEPQACILSVGAGEQRPVVKNGALAIATVMEDEAGVFDFQLCQRDAHTLVLRLGPGEAVRRARCRA